MIKNLKILTIDDDEAVRMSIAHYLSDSNYDVIQAENGAEGLKMFRTLNPDLILLDLEMPEMDGFSFLETISSESPSTPIIVVSGTESFDNLIKSIRVGSWDFISKPIIKLKKLEETILRNIKRAERIKQNEIYKQELEEKVESRTAELQLINLTLSNEIKARKKSEQMLIESLKEKDTMLKEIHHRVKNNLQIISSLLSLQVAKIEDERTCKILEECKCRVRSMSMLHESIYSSKDLTSINIRDYTHSLITSLFKSIPSSEVNYELNCNDFTLAIDYALPCGLILNELISNSLNHAFENRTANKIRITIEKNNNHISLIASDNGCGFEYNEKGNALNLGLTLVETLTKQLNGKMQVINDEGTTTLINFYID